jgi:hypothetical protein
MRRTYLGLAALCIASIVTLGCSGADEAGPDRGPGPSTPPSEGGAAPTPTPDPGPQLCPEASGVYGVNPAASNLLFLLDRSGSMHLSVSGDQTRWTMTKSGLQGLLQALPSETQAGLTMFPNGDDPITCCDITADNIITCGNCGAGELPGTEMRCDSGSYVDLPVGMAPLGGGQLDDIMSYVSSADDEFYWGTPLAPALDGAIDGALNLGMGGVTSVVLLTDGRPTSCDTDADPEANDIQRAVDAATSGLQTAVRTYVVGVIDGEAAAHPGNLSRIAEAGGTARYAGCGDASDCAYSVNVGNFEADLHDALASIALESMSCSYDLPEVEGGAPDYEAVNITVTSEGQTVTIPRDTGHLDGWDYLAGNEQVQLYGQACELLKGDSAAEVEVVVGCQTVGD